MYEKSFWQALAHGSRPVFIYGTGNGADKIIDIIEAFGGEVSGIFASDGFVRRRTFRGHNVQSYSDIRALYGDDISIVAAFGSTLPEVLDFLCVLDSRHDLYVPEVPLFCEDLMGELFTDEYFASHADEILAARSLFTDDRSVRLFDDMVNHRLSGRLGFLSDTEDVEASLRSLLPCGSIRTAIDGGAFKGDTARLFCDAFPELRGLAAVEPDAKSFAKLSALADDEGFGAIIPINALLSDVSGTSVIVSGGSRGSAVGGNARRARATECPAVTIDSIVSDVLCGSCDFIKLDTEGFEAKALDGAESTLGLRPVLSVSLYHRSADLFELPLRLAKYYPNARFCLRRPRCVPEWDLTLYVIPGIR